MLQMYMQLTSEYSGINQPELCAHSTYAHNNIRSSCPNCALTSLSDGGDEDTGKEGEGYHGATVDQEQHCIMRGEKNTKLVYTCTNCQLSLKDCTCKYMHNE